MSQRIEAALAAALLILAIVAGASYGLAGILYLYYPTANPELAKYDQLVEEARKALEEVANIADREIQAWKAQTRSASLIPSDARLQRDLLENEIWRLQRKYRDPPYVIDTKKINELRAQMGVWQKEVDAKEAESRAALGQIGEQTQLAQARKDKAYDVYYRVRNARDALPELVGIEEFERAGNVIQFATPFIVLAIFLLVDVAVIQRRLQRQSLLRRPSLILLIVLNMVLCWYVAGWPMESLLSSSWATTGTAIAASALFPLCLTAAGYSIYAYRRRVHQLAQERLAQERAEERRRQAEEELRQAAERDRRRQEDSRRQEDEARRRDYQQQSAKRRQEARSQCELLFNLHKADIAKRFTRKMFDDYMVKYMADAEDAEIVERRGRELREIIEKSLEQTGGRTKPTSIDQLATWFLDEKARIESLPLDEELKQDHLAHLNIRYADLSQEILENIKP